MASLRHVLTPDSVAVFGTGGHHSSLGQAILQNIISGGFPGLVYAVSPRVAEPDGVRCVPSAAELPEQVDLAIITAPAAAVLGIAEECGRRGVQALVVITSGLDGAARAELLGICRRHGMRMVGPNCFGVANASIPLDATLAARHPTAGSAAGAAVRRRRRRPARAPVPAGRRDLHLRLAGRQRRRVRQRHAAVVGVRRSDQAGRNVPGIIRKPAQVCSHGPPRRPAPSRSWP